MCPCWRGKYGTWHVELDTTLLYRTRNFWPSGIIRAVTEPPTHFLLSFTHSLFPYSVLYTELYVNWIIFFTFSGSLFVSISVHLAIHIYIHSIMIVSNDVINNKKILLCGNCLGLRLHYFWL